MHRTPSAKGGMGYGGDSGEVNKMEVNAENADAEPVISESAFWGTWIAWTIAILLICLNH